MRVLITGDRGFIGSVMVRAFTEAGWDISNDSNEVQYIVHCGEAIPSKSTDTVRLCRDNLNAMTHVIEFAQESGNPRICYLSSMDVFGKITDLVVNPTTPVNEPNNYGKTKRINEELLEKWGGQSVSIRLPGVIGKGGHHNFITNTMAAIMDGQPIQPHSPYALFNNVIHVGDLARFVVNLYGTMKEGHEVVTLGCSRPMRMHAVIDRLIEVSGKKTAVKWVPGGAGFRIGYEKAESLGYEPKTTYSTLSRVLA